MDDSLPVWVVACPVGGAVLAAAIGVLIPGVGPAILGAGGLAAGSALGVFLFVLASRDEPDNGDSRTPGSGTGTGADLRTGSVELAFVDELTGEPIEAPIDVTLEQTVIDERLRRTVEGGSARFDLRELGWDVTAEIDSVETSTTVAVGDTDREALSLPSKTLTVDVVDRDEDPLPEASVDCYPHPVDEAVVSAADDPGSWSASVPAQTRRVTVDARHAERADEQTEVPFEAAATAVTVPLERAAPDAGPESQSADSAGVAVGEGERDPAAERAGETDRAPIEEVTAHADQAGKEVSTPEQPAGGSARDEPPTPGSERSEPEPSATESGKDDTADDNATAGEAGAGDDATNGESEAESGGEPAADPSAGAPIEDLGSTGIDRHTPEESPKPPRLDVEASAISSADELLNETKYTTITRVTVADRDAAVTLPGSSEKGRQILELTVDRAEDWRAIDHHPHVARLLDSGNDPEPYMAVEYVDRTLAAVDGPLDQTRALWTAVCLADAVETAHRNGVYHLNLKPGNVLLERVDHDAWPVPKVTDWDLPRLFDPPSDVFRPFPNAYATPEQLSYDGADERTDVYQLGVLTHRLLTGEVPMSGGHATDRSSGAARPIPPVTGIDGSLHDDLDDILQRATAAPKSGRYASASAFREELLRVIKRVAGF